MLTLTKNIKSSVALLVAGLSLTQATVAPRQAHAVIAAASGGTAVPALIVLAAGAGGSLLGIGLVSVGGIAFGQGSNTRENDALTVPGLFLSAAGVLAILTGLVMLDESGAPTPDFQAITPALATEARIEARSVRAFNRQLDRVNSVSESIARGIAQKNLSDAQSAVQYAHGEWLEARDRGLISKDTFTALNGLSRHAIEKAQAALK